MTYFDQWLYLFACIEKNEIHYVLQKSYKLKINLYKLIITAYEIIFWLTLYTRNAQIVKFPNKGVKDVKQTKSHTTPREREDMTKSSKDNVALIYGYLSLPFIWKFIKGQIKKRNTKT